ncbi:hypothetical protein HDV01_007046 [Terramyces sp. JEL0728]|nr:hypothetical protein HDV01_007046 [Terramyces sp. JEL0728]
MITLLLTSVLAQNSYYYNGYIMYHSVDYVFNSTCGFQNAFQSQLLQTGSSMQLVDCGKLCSSQINCQYFNLDSGGICYLYAGAVERATMTTGAGCGISINSADYYPSDNGLMKYLSFDYNYFGVNMHENNGMYYGKCLFKQTSTNQVQSSDPMHCGSICAGSTCTRSYYRDNACYLYSDEIVLDTILPNDYSTCFINSKTTQCKADGEFIKCDQHVKKKKSVIYYGAEMDLDDSREYAYGKFMQDLVLNPDSCSYKSYNQCVEVFKNSTSFMFTLDSSYHCCLYGSSFSPSISRAGDTNRISIGVSLSNCTIDNHNWMTCNGVGENPSAFQSCLATLYKNTSYIYTTPIDCQISNPFNLTVDKEVSLEECMDLCHKNSSCQSNYWTPDDVKTVNITVGSNSTDKVQLGHCNVLPADNNGTIFVDVTSNNCIYNSTTQKCHEKDDIYNRYPADIYLNGVAFRKDFYSPFYVGEECSFGNWVNVQVSPISTNDCQAECLSDPNCSHYMNLFASCFKFSGVPLLQQIVPRNTSTCFIHQHSFDCLFNNASPNCAAEFQYQGVNLNGVLFHDNEKELYSSSCNIKYAAPVLSTPKAGFEDCRTQCLDDPKCTMSSMDSSDNCDIYYTKIDETVSFQSSGGSNCQIVKSRTDLTVHGRTIEFNFRKNIHHNTNDFVFGLKYQNIDVLNIASSHNSVFHYFTNTIGCEWIETNDMNIDTVLFVTNQDDCAWQCYINLDCTHFAYEFTENYSYGTCNLKTNFSPDTQMINNPSIKCGSLTERNACVPQNGEIVCKNNPSTVTKNNFDDVFFNNYLFSSFQDLALNYRCHWKNSVPIQSTPLDFGSQCAYLCQSLPSCTFYDWIRTMEYNTLPTCNLYSNSLDTSLMEPSWHECGWKMSTSNCQVSVSQGSLVCANSTAPIPSRIETTLTQVTTFVKGTIVVQGTTVANATIVNNGDGVTVVGGNQINNGQISTDVVVTITDFPTETVDETNIVATVTVVETVASKNEPQDYPPSLLYSVAIGGLIGSIFLNVLLVAALVKFNRDLSQPLDAGSTNATNEAIKATSPDSIEVSNLPSLTNSVLMAKFQEINNKNRNIVQVSRNVWTGPVSTIYLFANQQGMAVFNHLLVFFLYPRNISFASPEDVDEPGMTKVAKGDQITLKLHSFDGTFLGTNETKELVGKFPARIIPPPKECPKLILVHCPEYTEFSNPKQYEFFESTKTLYPDHVSLRKVEDYRSLVPNQYFSTGIFESLNNIKVLVSGSHDMMKFIYKYIDGVADEIWSYVDTHIVTYDYDIADDNYPYEY